MDEYKNNPRAKSFKNKNFFIKKVKWKDLGPELFLLNSSETTSIILLLKRTFKKKNLRFILCFALKNTFF